MWSSDALNEARDIIEATLGGRQPTPANAAPKTNTKSKKRQGVSTSKSIMTFFHAQSGTSHDNDCATTKVKPKNNGRCKSCGSVDIVTRVADSMRVCQGCDAVEFIMVDNERPVKRDAPKDSSSFCFKRLSHFNEWLAQIQGKDNPAVPEEIIGYVMEELRRHNIHNAADINNSQIRTILKKLKLSRYYEHVPYIISRIRGVPSERMPLSLEEKLKRMFCRIQSPFVRHSPALRKNFLSYGYVLHKFVELLGEDAYLSKFPLLKSREKLRMQDSIWKAICNDLDWQFIPSI
jgi:ribosomal protein L37AE/L43A